MIPVWKMRLSYTLLMIVNIFFTLMHLMILFLYKCVNIVVNNPKWYVCISCLTWSNILCNYLWWKSFVIQICLFLSHCSAVLRCFCQYISDEVFSCCCCCLFIQGWSELIPLILAGCWHFTYENMNSMLNFPWFKGVIDNIQRINVAVELPLPLHSCYNADVVWIICLFKWLAVCCLLQQLLLMLAS